MLICISFIVLTPKEKDTQISICFILSEHKERVSVSPKEIIVDVILTPIPKPSTPAEEVLLFGYVFSSSFTSLSRLPHVLIGLSTFLPPGQRNIDSGAD